MQGIFAMDFLEITDLEPSSQLREECPLDALKHVDRVGGSWEWGEPHGTHRIGLSNLLRNSVSDREHPPLHLVL